MTEPIDSQNSVSPGAKWQKQRCEIAWPHAPMHRLSASGTYLVTAGAYLKQHHFHNPSRLDVLQRGLLKVASDFGWDLEAWPVFSNHYHCVGHSPAHEEGAASLSRMLGLLHAKTAKWINRLDGSPGRKGWHNFRETLLTYQKSYLARLNYVHQNPVKHGVVRMARGYRWCSAAWFETTATPAQVETVYSFPTDRLNVYDDYTVSESEVSGRLSLECDQPKRRTGFACGYVLAGKPPHSKTSPSETAPTQPKRRQAAALQSRTHAELHRT